MNFRAYFLGLLALPLLSSCGSELQQSQTLIVKGQAERSLGASVVLVSDTRLGSCTGTVLSPRHILTASHCVQGGTGKPFVNVYGPGRSSPNPEKIAVKRFDIPAGVDAPSLSFQANDRRFADLAILTLEKPLPSNILPVSLADSYPGRSVSVLAVGNGEHDGSFNQNAELRSRQTRLLSSSDNSGAIVMDAVYTNPGDSGGPIFARQADGSWQVLGVLNGTVEYQNRELDRYTSVHEARNKAWIQQILNQ